MAYTICFSFQLPDAGLTLRAQLVDSTFGDVGGEISTGFDNPNSGNRYRLTASIPDDHRGFCEIYENGQRASGPLVDFSINEQELENPDVKTSTRSDFDETADNVTLADGSLTAAKIASAAITAAKIATDAIGADELAADAIAEIVADVMSETVPGSFAQGSAGWALGRIGTATITVTSPVATDGDVEIYEGDDYNNTDGRALDWTDSGGTWPDLTSATIAVVIDGIEEFAGSVVTPTGDSKKVRLELSATETAALNPKAASYQVIATLSSARVATLAEGTWVTKKRFAE